MLNSAGTDAQFVRSRCAISCGILSFKELESFLESLPLDDNNAVFTLCCRLCTAYERKAFHDGLLYGAHLLQELFSKETAQESSDAGVL